MNGAEAFNRVRQVVFSLVPNLDDPFLYDDLMSEGLVGLTEARQRYSDDRGASFWTYAHYRIRGRILNMMRKRGGTRGRVVVTRGHDMTEEAQDEDREPLPPGPSSLPPPRSLESRLTSRSVTRLIWSAMERLTPLERRLICRCIIRQQTIHRVAEQMGMSRRRGARIINKALLKMRARLEEQGYCLDDFI